MSVFTGAVQYIHSGGGSIFISNGGVISMSGLVLVNGKPVLVKED